MTSAVAFSNAAAFSVSPSTVQAPWRGTVTFSWQASGVASIAIRWTDDLGPHTFPSTSSSGSTSQPAAFSKPGTYTFNIYGYRDAAGAQLCAGPVSAQIVVTPPPTPTFTPVPVGISRFVVRNALSELCTGSSIPTVNIAWVATGGSDARIYLYRREYTSANVFVRETPLISGSPALSSSYVDHPNIPPPVDKVNYRLMVRNAAGQWQDQTQPSTLIWDYCLY